MDLENRGPSRLPLVIREGEGDAVRAWIFSMCQACEFSG